MALTGKISTEIPIQTSAAEFHEVFATKLHHIQNLCDRVHGTKLHEGEDWHSTGSVKHWTYVVDGKVTTCKETIEAIDEQNKSITYKLFDEDISQHYKVLKTIIQAVDKNDGGATAKFTVEYEKINEDVEPPYGYLQLGDKCLKDIEAFLVQAKKNNNN